MKQSSGAENIDKPATDNKVVRALLSFIIWSAIIFLAAFSLSSHFSQRFEILELTCHFKLLNCILAFALVMVMFALKRKLAAIASIIVLALNALYIVPLYLSAPPLLSNNRYAEKSGTEKNDRAIRAISVAGFNVWNAHNRQYDKAIDYVRRIAPDIVGFCEIDSGWSKALLESLQESYPYSKIEHRYCGVAIFSKYPLVKAEVKFFKHVGRPRIDAVAEIDNRSLRLIFLHPVTPTRDMSIRNQELMHIASDAASSDLPVIVFGDLNCTPWSPTFSKLLSRGKLTNTQCGFGPQPSWPAVYVPPFMPIDHILVSPELITLERKVGPALGSDHLPVYAKLSWGEK